MTGEVPSLKQDHVEKLIDKKYLRQEDVTRLNAYHRQVYETLAPKLTEEERTQLAVQTAPI